MSKTPISRVAGIVTREAYQVLEGEVLTRPALAASDGAGVTYSVDIRIIGHDDTLDNVPISPANRELQYVDIGAAVTLQRSVTGRFEVVGFSKRKPGRRVHVMVNLEDRCQNYVLGEVVDDTVSVRRLTYLELSTLGGGFGIAPYGAYARFRGEDLEEVGV